jgi:flagellum-specific peptidoglycan hydrolase FlgJ
MLVAQDAIETNWGKSVKGDYNYGNLTTTGTDWHNRTGDRKWRDFNSIEDYVLGKIDFLSKDRYKFFSTFTANSNISTAM